jgi:Family of unknown function (DUF5522)
MSNSDDKKTVQKTSHSDKFLEGRDYYFNEQGLMVLTAEFLLRRGYCCGNGCFHCPYQDDEAKKKFNSN